MPVTPLHMSCEVTQLETTDHRTASIVSVAGDIDWTTSGELGAAINKSFTPRPARLILDLKAASHIDSSGIATLLEGSQEAKRRRVRFFLCGLNHSARRTLERTRLKAFFDIRETAEQAL
jgi:anti-sigma B factor antagonist